MRWILVDIERAAAGSFDIAFAREIGSNRGTGFLHL